jgi:hypothetical protein
MMRPSWLVSLVVPAIVATVSGCEDTSKQQQQIAADVAAKLVPVAKEDAAQVRRGLPEGARKLGEVLDADPGANLVALQRSIRGARASVQDLDICKSTFFTFVDPTGVALRSEVDPDNLAQRPVFGTFPSLKKALEPTSGVVEAWGDMPEMRGVKSGQDLEWVVAHPVKDKEGQVKGVFVTGWSFRRFAQHLEEQAKRTLLDMAQRDKKLKLPIVYAFVVKDGKAYGTPGAPDVNVQAVEGLDLGNKTQGGPFRGNLEITGRSFGIAAERVPELGDGALIAVLASEI